MCGIAGTYQHPEGLPLAKVMSERLAHRGPDDAGLYSFSDSRISAHLAHRRLSIIDLAQGAQPMVKDGLAIVYNGELYNYRELRAELASSGSQFITNSDTEVVLESWRRFGPRCLPKLRGMFAFAVLDERSGSLFLARDPFGVKPLHYVDRGGRVLFASELKALSAALGAELEPDPAALVASVLFYWVPDSRCSLKGVQKLQPGTCAEFRPDGSHQVQAYFDIAQVAAAAAAGPAYDLREVIQGSVKAHLVADVPVSSFLSGGLDSGIVTVLAKAANPSLDAYTITFRREDQRLEAMPDDATYARKIAKRYGVELHEIEIAPDVVGLLPQLVDILDEPIGDPAAINTLLMCQAAREAGVKVVLSGMGADEMFGGYRKHVACLMAGRYRQLPGPARQAVRMAVDKVPVAAAGRGLRYARWAKRFLTFAELPEEEAFRRSYTLYDPQELLGLLDPALEPVVEEVLADHLTAYADNTLEDQVNRMCLADSRLFLPGLNLTYTDRASMAASTEVRVPFVDPVVFRAAFSLAGKDKIAGRKGKLALREAARAWLPDEIIDRPKASFSAPLRAWVRRDLAELVDDVLQRGELVGSGFLRQEAVRKLVQDDRSGREDRSKQIWQLLTLELWYRHTAKAVPAGV
ncbi:MAG: asparagine synthase (glutamine-hydrolyzing) [Actinobacteria bacterium]|nr:asparagine synthase (glutamine-hydrolyzing) [Actinomycetota bacterium]